MLQTLLKWDVGLEFYGEQSCERLHNEINQLYIRHIAKIKFKEISIKIKSQKSTG